ncbi:BCCT family transporter [Halofilum ochraceum]|uniref:BCCT family transporter n=1 Tax=Halofilum ochraceum TaxID=1611323 RepID=UPI00082C4A0A|nr:BCCT family transporter [Halofilum ochraceum]
MEPIPHKPLLFGLFKRTSRPVFIGSAMILFGLIAFVLRDPSGAEATFASLQSDVTAAFGWVYRYTMTAVLLFSLLMLVSRHGALRLGDPASKPSFKRVSWFAMMFGAGMGIGLLFWSVSEPLAHFANPPSGAAGTADAAQRAMRLTFFHWGLHAWAVYAVVGLALAYFGYRRGLPLTIRSTLFPLFGRRIMGWPGHTVDIIAVVATMFGVATSLGLGAIQLNAGLQYLFGVPVSALAQLLIVAAITALGTWALARGLDKGIEAVSRLNIAIAVILLVAVLLLGPTVRLLELLGQATTDYLVNIPTLSLWSNAFGTPDWQQQWTLFYWAWWISWSPFVGMFIAWISRGRTIREFLAGVLLVPAGATLIWLSVFGGTALNMELFEGAEIADATAADVSSGLFLMFDALPLSWLLGAIACIALVTFFVTSSTSGAFVIDVLTAGGDPDPPRLQRVFWSVMTGVVAGSLLLGGGLVPLQTAAILAGLPFTIVLLLLCVGVWRAVLLEESSGRQSDADAAGG